MAVKINNQLSIALISGAILTGVAISSASAETVRVFGIAIPPLCPFKLLSTWDCPGCGLTRSLVLALHGDWSGSYNMHIWGIPLALILLLQIPYRLYRFRRPNNTLPPVSPSVKKWVNLTIFLSLMMPWLLKTIAVALVRYL